jgi:phosphoenolpyruvate synthase/pyruvate phosphate dikinase
MIEQSVLGLHEVDEMQVAVVGGKGAHLGGLSRIDGIRVPAGFCVTTDAFRRIMAEAPSIDDRLDQLSRLNPDDREAIRTLSAEIRRTLEAIAIPGDLAAPARSPGSASKLPTPSDPARRQRTCRQPPSPASRTRT